ncbi:hypothetical protein JSQ81_08655 [Sporosarcina sp. Marseille-Q4063]|uniref:hypothetical protein n=1 Tax=Sporosarcina sp. Marseille-Q4063 TaxID=2810514 RepID=UPI001BB0C73C|nr:hypothetical protein [Sporosarcina sp. Marseille-Q4063]QUW23555.1 hypothetical protein JSQ81_08655 [Sporosarcina sp. Marseille-Q4063]
MEAAEVAIIQTVKEFIEKYVCKAGETVEQLSENEWEIHKWTARTFKTMGNVLVSEQCDVSPKEEIIKLKLKPMTRRDTLPIPQKLKDIKR